MLNILIVEDDVTIRELLSYNLKKNFKILEANSAEEAMEVCEHKNIHLILLDWMLPEMSGLSFLRTIKKQKNNSEIPVIFVTAREDEKDKIAGLTSGADDYITKPFSHLELLARVEAVLKRTYPNLYSDNLSYEDIKIDIKSHKVYRKNNLIKLSPKEYDLLVNFVINPKLVFSREQLLDKFWGLESDVELRTVDVHIRRLRKAINIEHCKEIIRTVRSTGYALD
jgi:two-component system phosphate regulon response regulator PhoB|tara:strand:+ start:633 stop:1307 length:675 start_codon:yes stop_codon:yes gene_type:complete